MSYSEKDVLELERLMKEFRKLNHDMEDPYIDVESKKTLAKRLESVNVRIMESIYRKTEEDVAEKEAELSLNKAENAELVKRLKEAECINGVLKRLKASKNKSK